MKSSRNLSASRVGFISGLAACALLLTACEEGNSRGLADGGAPSSAGVPRASQVTTATGAASASPTPAPPATSPNASGAARVFYSDLDSGPTSGGLNNKGAMVTISGRNFGATRGKSVVTVGGGEVDNYVSWSDTKVVVQLGSAAKSGDIVVVNATGEASNGIPFTVRAGPIYFVSATGTGHGAFATPMPPSAVYKAIVPGATFYFRGGDYAGLYGYTSYSDYNFTLGGSQGGSAGNPVAFVGYPGEVAAFSGHKGVFHFRDGDAPAPTAGYLTIANLRMVCKVACVDGAGNGYLVPKAGGKAIRVINNVMSATYNDNTMTGVVTVANDGWRIYGNEIKDTGTTPPINNNHAIYIQVGSSDVDLAWNYLHDLRMGHVIQVHTDTAFKYENVRIHDNLITAAHQSDSRGINVGNASAGTYGSIYNNVLSNLGQNFSAIAIYSGAWNISNNTLYNINASTGMVWLSGQYGGQPTAVLANNIFHSDGKSPYLTFVSGASPAQATASNNLYFNKGAGPSLDKAPINANPLFVNAAAGNFHLQSNSPAIGKGTSSLGAVGKRDADGVERPLPTRPGIGAFEHAVP